MTLQWPDDGTTKVMSEVQAYVQGGTAAENQIRRNEVFLRLKLARGGKLVPKSQVKEVDMHADLWEIRWEAGSRHLRLYEGEPARYPDHLVALRFHEKNVTGSKKQIRASQDSEIKEAVRRYKAWDPSDWFI